MEENDNHYKGLRAVGDILRKTNDQQRVPQPEFVVDWINSLSLHSTIYHGLTTQFGLKPVSIILLAVIVSFQRDNRICWHSLGSLAEFCGSTVPTVIKHLKALENIDLIKRGPKHPRYGTTQWVLGDTGSYKFKEIQKNISRAKENKPRGKENLRGW